MAVLLGVAMTLAFPLFGENDVTLVPVTIGLATALALVPFPMADRLLALSLIGTMPLIWSDRLPNVPLAAAVLVIGLIRIAPIEARFVHRRTWVILAASWAPLAAGVALAHWPPVSVWLRPTALLALGAAAAVLGVLVWRDPDRRQRWLEGITLGLLITAVSGLVVFSLQFFVSFAAIVDRFADLQGLLRGTSAGETFRDQNNWLIPGEQITVRAISPLFPSPNNLGAYLGVATPIAFVLSLSHPRRAWRMVALAATALAVALAVLTLSRSTWLATAVAGTLIVGVIAVTDRSSTPSFGVRRNALKLGLNLAVVALAALVVAAAAGGDDVIDRVLNPLADESVTDRLDTNDQAVQNIATDPVRGVGLGNWRATIANQDDVAYIHNVYIEYSAAVGVLGGIWALMVIVVPLIAGITVMRRAPSSRERLLGVVILAIFAFAAIHFMFDDNLLNPQYAWLLFFA
ncbi:MAG TPA: O-antigen ligase family protein, partial [Candidatus Limnocylindria bacterium]